MKYTKTTRATFTAIRRKEINIRVEYRYLNACDEKQPEVVTNCFISGEVDINFGHIGQFHQPTGRFCGLFLKILVATTI